MHTSETRPIAYLTGEYPRATDTFIQREVAALRLLGQPIVTCSIRKTGSEHLVGEQQRSEAQATFYVLAAALAPLHLLWCHMKALVKSPRRYLKALLLALTSGDTGPKAFLYQLFYFAEAAVLADHLHRHGVRHLHNHIAKSSCSVAMITSEMSGIPYSFTLHGPDIFFAPEKWRLDKKIETARFVACISHYCRAQAMAFSDPAYWSKMHIVHCGVNPDQYAAHHINSSTHNLLFIGRLSPVKGLPVLFDALTALVPKFPELHLTLIGDGPDRAALEAMAKQLGLAPHVTFVGYQSQGAVAAKLSQTNMLVLPSFAEGVPVVLMEAMAAEIPVVATQIAGVPELVEHGVSGFLVPPGDTSALAKSISDIWDNPALAKKMGKAGRAKIQAEFNIASESLWLHRLFQGYASESPPLSLRQTLQETGDV